LFFSLSQKVAARPGPIPCPGTPLCPDCPNLSSAKVELGQALIYTGLDVEGTAYEATLELVEGEASLRIEGADDIDCNNGVCSFVGNGNTVKLIVTGNPGPATFYLDAYPVE
ncbi:MAG: hypothetical protein AAFU79_18130, partial [Myxococcota bacterium]